MVTVKGAPGYEDFEGEMVMEFPRGDGVTFCIIRDPLTSEIFVIRDEYVQRDGQK
jgi:hypothetical protein